MQVLPGTAMWHMHKYQVLVPAHTWYLVLPIFISSKFRRVAEGLYCTSVVHTVLLVHTSCPLPSSTAVGLLLVL